MRHPYLSVMIALSEYDIEDMISGGEIIASYNKEKQSLVLYPRGKSFLSRLSGTITAFPGKQIIHTTAPLCDEIRRGEAIQVYIHENYAYKYDGIYLFYLRITGEWILVSGRFNYWIRFCWRADPTKFSSAKCYNGQGYV